jgi:hypothetical protein
MYEPNSLNCTSEVKCSGSAARRHERPLKRTSIGRPMPTNRRHAPSAPAVEYNPRVFADTSSRLPSMIPNFTALHMLTLSQFHVAGTPAPSLVGSYE